MNCHCLPCKRWIYAPLLHFRQTVQAQGKLEDSGGRITCSLSEQRCQKPSPAHSKGVYRCTWELRRLRVMVTHVWCLWPQREVSALHPSELFVHCQPNKGLPMVFHVLVLCQLCHSSSASSALKSSVVFQQRSVRNAWVWNMGCISSLLGKRLVSIVSLYSWTDGKPECQSFFAQIFQADVQKMMCCAKQWKTKMLY